MDKYQILTFNHISSHGLHRFPAARYLVGKSIEAPDAIILRSHDLTPTPSPSSTSTSVGRP